MFTDLKLEFEKFLNHSFANFMFVDGVSGMGKTSFAKETINEFNNLHKGETSVLLTQAPYIDNEREFIRSLLRDEFVFNKKMSKTNLKTILLTKLSNCRYLVIDDSQNLLISRRLLMNHFWLMSWLVNETNIKVMYLGTIPFQEFLEEYDTIFRRSVVYNLKAS
ncbi:AAA family ATPase [Paenibacillus sp. CGMCC 1.16610]|uniref:AAA family ATPase n=1 Tax=Paenibacillus anseongense TaxID=2682845 RepID=A0ABW9UJR9_9BACL|nr:MULTISPECIES: AAA family ATPase [Paenibacillus]MBA2939825.1 AAA family ATPase [Paenibacillus sp. CGMCC 1.16610]MVQ39485.1 AAA family ATPase [Paenibacillus anseongense]